MKATDLFSFQGWSACGTCGPQHVAIRAGEVAEVASGGNMTTMANGHTGSIRITTRTGYVWLLPEGPGQTFESICKALAIDE